MSRRITALLAVAATLYCYGVAGDTVSDDSCDAGFCAATADRHGHLLMAADLAAASGSAAGMGRGQGEADSATRDALEACGMLYGAASVPALRLLRGYTAAAGAPRAAAAHGAGRDRVRGNREFDQLSTMATALLNKQVT